MSVANSAPGGYMEFPFYVYDNESEEFMPIHFADLEAAEQYIERDCRGDYERYVVFKRMG